MAKNEFEVLTQEKNKDRKVSRILISSLIFAFSMLIFWALPRFQQPYDSSFHQFLGLLHFLLWWEGYVSVLMIALILNTIQHRSLADALAYSFGAGAGLGINGGGYAVADSSRELGQNIAWAFAVGSMSAIAVGVTGYLIGSSIYLALSAKLT